jgi:6-pyruvoyltetrahydropterin/6-carboxytetrahydropterin synthase
MGNKKFVSTKTYTEIGPVCYRQYLADSHCRLLHGYSLSFHIEFESDTLDVRNWVVDYGSLRSFKDKLEDWFDHTLLVAETDPNFDDLMNLQTLGLAKCTVVERTGCEGLAQFIFDYLEEYWLPDNGYKNTDHHVDVKRVEVRETGNNMAYVEKI